jgi:hypothetical protein
MTWRSLSSPRAARLLVAAALVATPAVSTATTTRTNRFKATIPVPRYGHTRTVRSSVRLPQHPRGAYVVLQIHKDSGRYSPAFPPDHAVSLVYRKKQWGTIMLRAHFDAKRSVMSIAVSLRNTDKSGKNPGARRGRKVRVVVSIAYST